MKITIKSIFIFLFSGFLTFYFLYSALNGQYGIFNKYNYLAEEVVLSNNLTELRKNNLQLEKRVARLSDEFLDIDLLDQQARMFLGLAKPNEIIIQIK